MATGLRRYVRNIFPTRFYEGAHIFLGNIRGVVIGGIVGFFASKQYETGLLLQRQLGRAFTFMGMQGDVILRMIFFILFFAFVGAIIEKQLRGK